MFLRIDTDEEEYPGWQICERDLPVHVGRHPEVGIRLNDPKVSHVHCRIDEFHGVLWVCDVGSTLGTFVNGVRIDESPLFSGDWLTVGTTHLRIHYQSQCEPRVLLA